MAIKILSSISILSIVFFFSCKTDQTLTTPVSSDNSWLQSFDNISEAQQQGWLSINNSIPKGVESWTQAYSYYETKGGSGGASLPPQSYTNGSNDYVIATYNCGSDTANISAWLISPKTVIKNGDKIIFYTSSMANTSRPDRLQVRLNATNTENVGEDSASVGDFKTLLLDINPQLKKSGPTTYPKEWTKYTITIDGLPAAAERRFAFRYFVNNAGPGGKNSYGVGIDSVAFVSAH